MPDSHGGALRRRGGRRLIVLIGCITGIAVAAGVAYATIPDAGGVVHLCYKDNNGNLRVIDPAASKKDQQACKNDEVALDRQPAGAGGRHGGDRRHRRNRAGRGNGRARSRRPHRRHRGGGSHRSDGWHRRHRGGRRGRSHRSVTEPPEQQEPTGASGGTGRHRCNGRLGTCRGGRALGARQK